MTTARPQAMSNDPDTSDDLIAELAKLMAQDAQAPVALQPQAVNTSGTTQLAPVRQELKLPAPVGRTAGESVSLDFGGEDTASPHIEPQLGMGPVPRLTQVRSQDQRASDAAGPRVQAETVAREQAASRSQQVATQSRPAAAAPTSDAEERDAIADLIAAELGLAYAKNKEAAEPVNEATEPTPAPTARQEARREPVVQEHDQAPVRTTANVRSFTPIAASPRGQAQPARPVLRQLRIAAQPQQAEQARVEQPRIEQQRRVEPAPVQVEPQGSVARQAGDDNFSVAPVFGLSGRTSVPAPPAKTSEAKQAQRDSQRRDPIDEIESLIGEAVRVQIVAPQVPAVPEKRRVEPKTPLAKAERSNRAAEEAILAAAAVSGADVAPVESEEFEDVLEAEQGRERRRFNFRPVIGPLVATTLLLASGFGLYSVLGLSGNRSGEAPVLTAEAGAIKEEVVAIPSASAGQRSAVFDEIQGVPQSGTEQLVAREEVIDAVDPVVTADVSEEGLANRKVRTVTVRPDGTIVSGETALAASELLPVDRPNVPELPSANVDGGSLLAGLTGAPGGANALSGNPAPVTAESAATEVAAVEPEQAVGGDVPTDATALTSSAPALTTEIAPQPTVPSGPPVAVDLAGNLLQGVEVPVPMPRLSRGGNASLEVDEDEGGALSGATSPVNALVSETPVALTTTAPVAGGDPQDLLASVPARAVEEVAPAEAQITQVAAIEQRPAPSSSAAAAYVQLSSQRTEADAKSSLTQLQRRYGTLFGGEKLEIQKTDLGQRGVFFRVRLPAASSQSAKQICSKIQAAGGECFAT